jgi:DUF4097 and DUF4098 domain-containing protein YvlB
MPTFDTPEPISAAIELAVGEARVSAGDRVDTVVEVRPRDDSKKADVKAANDTRVDYVGGKLVVKTPRPGFFGIGGAVDVTIELPSDSRLDVDLGAGSLRADGRLGDCRVDCGAGGIHLGETAALRVKTGAGDVTAGRVGGRAAIGIGSGDIRIDEIDGSAVVKNSNGRSSIGTVTGDAQVKSANGSIEIGSALATVTAKTANGSIRVGEVVRGAITLESALGEIEIGIREGTAAWLEVSAKYGRVRNSLDQSAGPGESDNTVEVHARTSYGSIVIRRA